MSSIEIQFLHVFWVLLGTSSGDCNMRTGLATCCFLDNTRELKRNCQKPCRSPTKKDKFLGRTIFQCDSIWFNPLQSDFFIFCLHIVLPCLSSLSCALLFHVPRNHWGGCSGVATGCGTSVFGSRANNQSHLGCEKIEASAATSHSNKRKQWTYGALTQKEDLDLIHLLTI